MNSLIICQEKVDLPQGHPSNLPDETGFESRQTQTTKPNQQHPSIGKVQ